MGEDVIKQGLNIMIKYAQKYGQKTIIIKINCRLKGGKGDDREINKFQNSCAQNYIL